MFLCCTPTVVQCGLWLCAESMAYGGLKAKILLVYVPIAIAKSVW